MATRTGRVVAFDATRGAGLVEDTDGTRFPFHCTSVADGTRKVAVGATVGFSVAAGLPGRWEAVDLRKHSSRSQ